MTFSYDGTHFSGYQKQPSGRTVQEELEKQLTKLQSNQKVILHASGRTDAHVHAYAQKAHFDFEGNMDVNRMKNSLNQLLPADIYVIGIEQVSDTFHARFDVKAKEYVYQINMGEYNPFERNYVYQYNQRLDVSKIVSALHNLEGTHNFKAFTKVDEEKESYERTIYRTNLHCENNLLVISFLGNGFLRYMVRNMVGTLIEIGEGKRKCEDIKTILESKDRKQAGKTAPPEGLYLKNVYYEAVNES